MRLATMGIALLWLIGCSDSKSTDAKENSVELCSDNIDNDNDSHVDCDDPDCAKFEICTPFEPDTEDTWHHKENRGEVTDPGIYVSETSTKGAFELVADKNAAPLVVSDDDFDGVRLAVDNLAKDIKAVTDTMPDVEKKLPSGDRAVIVGTVGSPLIDDLVESEKLDISDIEGKWETFLITTVDEPAAGLDSALVIVGSDQRGTIFGVYDLSSQMGVSPWYFFADVPPKTKEAVYVEKGVHSQGEPAVKYRGFFLNDENPALQRWHESYFPDDGYVFKKDFYGKVFELMLRIKANYLWPAVWGRAFAEDDPKNHAEAKRYGIVMGTSHEAPMMRGIEEWNRHVDGESDPYGGNGEWSYRTNKEAVEAYWREGIERMVTEDFEGVVTIGMRGPGDVGLAPEDGIALAEDFFAAQREIIAEEFDLHPAQVPQVWTLYKEVLDWWDEGLRPPSDVTVIWTDDNWGNMRRLPDPAEPERSGGYGLYYHFDYVGGPRNYKWVDTQLIPNVWEQLHLSYTMGVDRIWVVNVGDLKGNELPTQFFMDYAWNPERWPLEQLPEWTERFATAQFGNTHGDTVADLLHRYSLLQSDRKPELTNEGSSGKCPFHLNNYREMERVTAQWTTLADEAADLKETVSDDYQDTYYQLVYYPIKASALMYELRLAQFRNIGYAKEGRTSANREATIAEEKFEESRAMADYYNTTLSDGKWDGFQTQPYLGYSDWQQPEEDNAALEDFIYPELVEVTPHEGSRMGIVVDGGKNIWPKYDTISELPAFSPYQVQPTQYVEIYNLGIEPFEYEVTVTPSVPWFEVTPATGTISDNQARVEFAVTDWTEVPTSTTLTVTILDTTNMVAVETTAIVENPSTPPKEGVFIEANGYVSMKAGNYSRVVDAEPFTWTRIPDIGRTGDGMTPFPVNADHIDANQDGARLEYDMHLFTTGEVTVYVYLSPRQNVRPSDGLTMALSFDEDDPTPINITQAINPEPESSGWKSGVSNNTHRISMKFNIDEVGEHTLKLWAQDPTVIIQKIVINTGGMVASYLGPPESMRLSD